MGGKVGTEGSFDDLNLTPLIDVVLVVLIIMMVSIPIQVQEMGVKVPDPTAKPPPKPPDQPPPDQLVVSIYADGTIALNRRLMDPNKLSFELNRRIRGMAKKNVFIDADITVPYAKVVEMIDIARAEGAVKVGLAKVKEGGPQPYTSVDPGTMPRGLFIGSPIVNGMITEKKADSAIQAIADDLTACYVTELGTNPVLTGRMMLTVKLIPDGSQFEEGKISGSSLKGASPGFDACILETLNTLTSEPLGEDNTAAVTYPIIFSPG